MKIAVSGKGGVGKSTVSAALALLMAKRGGTVLALDADPDANLAGALGIGSAEQKKIVPISKQIKLIEERTESKITQYGQMFKLNPEVSDIAEKYAYKHNGVSLLVLGAVAKGGGGCACPGNTFIRALVSDLVLYKNETLIMDMEAGIEHLGRATSSGVDIMIIVVEPGQRSIDCAKSIISMSGDIGLKNIVFVGNKITDINDENYIKDSLPGSNFFAMIPYSEKIRDADRDGVSILDTIDEEIRVKFMEILLKVVEL
ncbi:MAG: carbon monoxide dehydrogenase [Ruminiclostridium sp.]|nr:carbon monoxide dehydrogenase [Ruminiclostridium sp.]